MDEKCEWGIDVSELLWQSFSQVSSAFENSFSEPAFHILHLIELRPQTSEESRPLNDITSWGDNMIVSSIRVHRHHGRACT